MRYPIFTIFIIFIYSCKPQLAPTLKTAKSTKNNTITCQLIEKSFINKGGKITEYKELYLRCSIQDYFIKLCEGNVSIKELKHYINKGIEVETEIKDGMWDHCYENDAYAQSRTGTYIVIKKIIE